MKEIERKFLVNTSKWRPTVKGVTMKQGYLSTDPERVVRVRIAGEESYLTIKGKTEGISRTELEYQIPGDEAEILMEMCLNTPIEKVRYTEVVNCMTWEIDVFEGANQGLVMAEIELKSEEEKFDLPDWILNEVSFDHRFFNSWLSKHPYSSWGKETR